MLKRILTVSTIFLSLANAHAGGIDDIGVQFKVKPGVYNVIAGQVLELPLEMSIDHPEKSENVLNLQLWGVNLDHGGAKSLDFRSTLIDDGKVAPLPQTLSFPTTAAMSGDYVLQGLISDWSEWNYVLRMEDNVVIHVTGSPPNEDLEGPAASSIKMKRAFRVGEKIELDVTINDKSQICLNENTSVHCGNMESIALICHDSNGVCLDGDGDGYINSGGTIKPLGNNVYHITLDEAPQGIGSYGVELSSFTDVWGNQERGSVRPVFFQIIR